VAGAVLLAAAVYQLTPLKDACLSRCRSPLTFVTTRWRDGRAGALVMGIEHGAWCAGCCWALMASLFALGVMSVAWMVFIAALMSGEKLLPWKGVANRGIAVLLLALGLGVAFMPERVPALTIPDHHDGMDHGGVHREAVASICRHRGAIEIRRPWQPVRFSPRSASNYADSR
jgi:hypothetical protein